MFDLTMHIFNLKFLPNILSIKWPHDDISAKKHKKYIMGKKFIFVILLKYSAGIKNRSFELEQQWYR